jgi:hypothetical protein
MFCPSINKKIRKLLSQVMENFNLYHPGIGILNLLVPWVWPYLNTNVTVYCLLPVLWG